MPEISRFYGIVIYIFYREHQPPHFHAVYGEYEASIGIGSAALLYGHLPPRVLGLVVEWATIHQIKLRQVWEQAVRHQRLDKIAPLQ